MKTYREKKGGAGVFSCEAKVFPQVNLKGAAPRCYHALRSTLFCSCREKCFWANPNTVYSNSDIIYLSTRGPPAGLWHSEGDVLPCLHEWARSWGGRQGEGEHVGGNTQRGWRGWDGEFYKLTRTLLFGQVEPADSLTFHQLVFLRFNGHTVINQMSGLDRHARDGFKTFCLDRCLVRCVAV